MIWIGSKWKWVQPLETFISGEKQFLSVLGAILGKFAGRYASTS